MQKQYVSIITIVLATSIVISAVPPSPLVLLVRPAQYFSTTYTAPPVQNCDYIFFRGEPITITVDVANWDRDVATAVPVTPGGTRANFSFSLRRDGVLQTTSAILDTNAVKTTRDGLQLPIDMSEPLELRYHETLTALAHVPAENVSPGIYSLDVRTNIVDGSGLPVRRQASHFLFEIRDETPDAALEITTRRALRAFVADDFREADANVARLVAMNPTSFMAFLIRGDIAHAQGRPAEALNMYRRAEAILQAGSDERYRRWASRLMEDHDLAAVQAKIFSVGRSPV
jgi:hypothetical protein